MTRSGVPTETPQPYSFAASLMRCGPSAQAPRWRDFAPPNHPTNHYRYRYRISDSHGRGRSTSPMGIHAPALPRSQTWARKGSMGACAHIDPLPSLVVVSLKILTPKNAGFSDSRRRVRGLCPLKLPAAGRGRGSGFHGGVTQYADPSGRLAPHGSIPKSTFLADLGKERVDGAERPSTLIPVCLLARPPRQCSNP